MFTQALYPHLKTLTQWLVKIQMV